MLLLQLLGWPEAFHCFLGKGPTKDVDAIGPPQEYTLLQLELESQRETQNYEACAAHHLWITRYHHAS